MAVPAQREPGCNYTYVVSLPRSAACCMLHAVVPVIPALPRLQAVQELRAGAGEPLHQLLHLLLLKACMFALLEPLTPMA